MHELAEEKFPMRMDANEFTYPGSAVISLQRFAFLAGMEQDRWMPIETAPRDGTIILLLCNDRLIPVAGKYDPNMMYEWTPAEYLMRGIYIDPTHWQPFLPLPSAPVKQ